MFSLDKCQITEIPHDLNYLLLLTSAHININFDTQRAETQRRKVEFKNCKTNHFFDCLKSCRQITCSESNRGTSHPRINIESEILDILNARSGLKKTLRNTEDVRYKRRC